jgi:hypothetical protein
MASPMHRFLAGGLSGLAATVPMTAFMRWADQRPVESPRSTLPPRRITEEALGTDGDGNRNEEVTQPATLVAHYSVGTSMGSLFGLLHERPEISVGIAHGAAVWAASYFGVLPAMGSQARGTQQNLRQNTTMFAAHLIWGASLAVAYDLIGAGCCARRQGQATEPEQDQGNLDRRVEEVNR